MVAKPGQFYRATTSAKIEHKVLLVADTEYEYEIPNGTRKIEIQNSNANVLRYAWESGKVATPEEPYGTIKINGTKYDDNINLYNKKIYFASSNAGDVVEIETWQ